MVVGRAPILRPPVFYHSQDIRLTALPIFTQALWNLEICILRQAPSYQAFLDSSTDSLADLCRRFGILKSAFRDRRWEADECLTTPPSPGILPPSHHRPSLPPLYPHQHQKSFQMEGKLFKLPPPAQKNIILLLSMRASSYVN